MIGRFAPSPTGYMHLGNLWIALLSYISVRQQQGTFILRIEDIDLGRAKLDYEEALIEDLAWLGFTWDVGPGVSANTDAYRQSERRAIYQHQLEIWKKTEDIYPCFCNRARLHSISSAPHLGEERPYYDGHCRGLSREEIKMLRQEKEPSWRIKIKPSSYSFFDKIQGLQSGHLMKGVDDFVVRRADGMYAYQLAATLDDALMGVTEVVRGADLLSSTGWQLFLFSQLGYPAPCYAHAPLLKDCKGYRLSKRQQGISVRELKQSGWSAGRILAELAWCTGLVTRRYQELSLMDLLAINPILDSVTKEDVILTKFDIML